MEEKVTKKKAVEIYKQNNNRVIDNDIDGFVVLKDVNKVYDNNVQAVFDFNLSVAENEFIVLVGPSGCGKSTTLRMIAGLEEISSGFLYIDKVLSNYLESKDRDIAMVFQSYALYPNMTVFDNIGFGLKVRGVPKEEIKEKVFEAAKFLNLGEFLDRRPRELSGGQMQRVALGRAIVRNAKLFLMDEPLSNLDAKLRVAMRSEIVRIHKNIHATTIYVTHDQIEAMTMADRIVIMNQGIVQQIGAPMEIYNNPKNVFVATFIGNPPMNVVKAEIKDGGIAVGDATVSLPKIAQKTFAEFIENRHNYFIEFKRNADLSVERELSSTILALVQKLKSVDKTELIRAVTQCCDTALELSRDKGFFAFSDEEKTAMLSYAENGDVASLKSGLRALDRAVSSSALEIAGRLKTFDSAGVFKSKSKDVAPIVKKKKKGKTEKVEVKTLEEQNLEIIDRYLAEYGAPDAKTTVFMGIRPEDIHFAADFNGNKSRTIKSQAVFVELLGSEFCVHLDMFDNGLIMKRGIKHLIKTGDACEVCFDMDKLCLFDPISYERVI